MSLTRVLVDRWLKFVPVGARRVDTSDVVLLGHHEASHATAAMRDEAARGSGTDIPRDADIVALCERLEVFLATPRARTGEGFAAWVIVEALA